ncbi:AraC family transcriptional regulator [Paenibacillus sp. J5C_2022]|uniref:AraC family transcriptional regulator n=1 Tax=Paenibacillus sp. J5C2022 TaxID=2977129 RepID=UPI0021CFC174|nr:AraC family transcriptional regulator [Paenibacillus sp. J5C2022]MCU6708578.1 AraC family transcriptional regulator [Paenibacillus sp. J5C2022]
MNRSQADGAVQEMLLNMQVQIIEANLTQCWPDWRELDYTPAYNKLYFILDGEGWVKVGERELYPEPGQLIMMPAHAKQSYSAISDRPFHKYWCHFTATAGGTDVFQWLDMPLCYNELDRERLEGLFRELVDARRSYALVSRLKEKSVLLHILTLVMENQPLRISESHSQEMERLTRIQQYVDSHLQRELTLEELASVLHLHPNYFSKYFKRHFGVSPLKYVSRKRMEHAKLLLKTSSQSIKEIAQATGFEDANYFSKTFRREVGYSPTEYRVNV